MSKLALQADLGYNMSNKIVFVAAMLEASRDVRRYWIGVPTMDTLSPRANDGNIPPKHSRGPAPKPALERFLSHIQVKDTGYETPCWLWNGSINQKGYGLFNRGARKAVLAHRWSYEYFIGQIPTGLQLDHLCRIHNCVNPEHLESVTGRTNTLRGKNGLLRPNKVSQYPGVRWREDRQRWQAYIGIGQQFRHLGHFHSEEEAHQARMRAERDLT